MQKFKSFHQIREEAEEIAELSKARIGGYLKRATGTSGGDAEDADTTNLKVAGRRKPSDRDGSMLPGHSNSDIKRQTANRRKGMDRAISRLSKEETELDELSKSTLGSYVKKASKSSGNMVSKIDKLEPKVKSGSDAEKRNMKRTDKFFNRQANIGKAIEKMSK